MPKQQSKSQQAAAMFGQQPPAPGQRQQNRDFSAIEAMGMLTEEELRHPQFYTELYQHKNQAMERDLMHAKATFQGMLHISLQRQVLMRSIADQMGMFAQVLSHPEVQHKENIKPLLTRCQRLHEEAKDMARPMFDVREEEIPKAVPATCSKNLPESIQAQRANGEPEEPQVKSQSSRRKRRNRRHAAGQDAKSKVPTE